MISVAHGSAAKLSRFSPESALDFGQISISFRPSVSIQQQLELSSQRVQFIEDAGDPNSQRIQILLPILIWIITRSGSQLFLRLKASSSPQWIFYVTLE